MHFFFVSPCSNFKDVDFDAERFLKDIELAMKPPDSEGAGSNVDIEEDSSSDMEFGKILHLV